MIISDWTETFEGCRANGLKDTLMLVDKKSKYAYSALENKSNPICISLKIFNFHHNWRAIAMLYYRK